MVKSITAVSRSFFSTEPRGSDNPRSQLEAGQESLSLHTKLPPPVGEFRHFCRGESVYMHGKCSCAKFVGCFHSSDTSKMRTYGTKHPWMDLETSCHNNSSSSTIHTAARFRHCCIQLSMKRWCQLNRARVAHDAHPTLSFYQNKCSKPGRSHHSSDIGYGA